MKTQGLHHVTAICGDPQRNVDFYAGLLGLRLVKMTVNFDDPGTYHLYYGDAAGTPGTILTFFPWAGAPRGRHGVGQTTGIAYSAPANQLAFWQARIPGAEPLPARFGQHGIACQDPDGLELEIVAGEAEAASPALDKFHSVTLSEAGHDGTARLLAGSMGLEAGGEEGNRFRYRAPDCLIDILCQPDARRGSMGTGTVHHIAWRAESDASQREWRAALAHDRYDVTPILDRQYFHSIYFREPGGVLFEIATDPPGFAIDEPAGQLGKNLKLPPWLEPRRARIEAILPKLVVPEPPFAA